MITAIIIGAWLLITIGVIMLGRLLWHRQIAMRVWIVLSLGIIFVVTMGLLGVTGVILNITLKHGINQQAATTFVRAASTQAAQWRDPAWQQQETAKLKANGGYDLLIRDANGRVIYQNNPSVGSAMPAANGAAQTMTLTTTANQISITTVGAGTIYLIPRASSMDWIYPLVIVFALMLSLLLIAFFIQRAIIHPLVAMEKAAHQIAANDLDVQVASSPIREVAQVSAAFVAMGEGLRAAVYQQAELEQERRIFVSAVAHDLRTPLFSLRGYLEGLERGAAHTPDKIAAYIAVCQEKATTLERLIADLFAYAQLEYLEQPPHFEPLELSDLLQKVVDGLQTRAAEKAIDLRAAGADYPCVVRADAHLLTRAAENLLENALRYTPAGGTVLVGWRRKLDKMIFTVSDSGPGIAPQDLPHLFTPMYRGEQSRNRQTGGAGLGLTIARRILLAHQGDLVATNVALGGAEFIGSLCPYVDEEV